MSSSSCATTEGGGGAAAEEAEPWVEKYRPTQFDHIVLDADHAPLELVGAVRAHDDPDEGDADGAAATGK